MYQHNKIHYLNLNNIKITINKRFGYLRPLPTSILCIQYIHLNCIR